MPGESSADHSFEEALESSLQAANDIHRPEIKRWWAHSAPRQATYSGTAPGPGVLRARTSPNLLVIPGSRGPLRPVRNGLGSGLPEPGGQRYPFRSGSGEWRNWQTRRIQVPVIARSWGFKSPLAHHLLQPFWGFGPIRAMRCPRSSANASVCRHAVSTDGQPGTATPVSIGKWN